MKLGMVVLKPDLAIKEIAYRQMTNERFELAFDAGVISIKQRDRPDDEPYLVPFGNVHFMRPLPKEKKT